MGFADEKELETAAFRYGLICEALESEDEKGVTLVLMGVTSRSHVHPDGRTLQISLRTLWRWYRAYRQGKLQALCPKRRADRGKRRALTPDLWKKVEALRRSKHSRATATIIDILERTKVVKKGQLARSTVNRHLLDEGLSRRALAKQGNETFKKIATNAPFELVVIDFHHGPYVRLPDGSARKALLCAFIDHWSRYIPEGRYFLHEDFVALRFSFVSDGGPEIGTGSVVG